MPVVWKFGGDRLIPLTPELVEKTDFPPSSDDVDELDISCRVWDRPSLEALFAKLPTDMSSLTILTFDDIIAGLHTDLGLAALEYLAEIMSVRAPNLQVLNFRDNATGTRGIKALAPLLKLSGIHSIDATNNGLSEEVMVEFNSMVKNPMQLVSLKFGRNQIGKGAFHVGALLSKCQQLQVFCYDGSRPSSEGTVPILEGLKQMNSSELRELNLYDCTINTVSLAPVIENAPKLKTLNLSSTNIDLSQEESVLNVLVNYSLVHLDLSYQDEWVEEEEQLQLLVDYFQNAPKTLQDVALEGCILGDEGLTALLPVLSLHPITHMNLQTNALENMGSLIEQRDNFPHLQHLNLRDNLDLEGLDKLQAAYPSVTILVEDSLQNELQAAVTDNEAAVDNLANQLAGTGV